MERIINTFLGEGVYSHSETDTEFYKHNGDYSYKKGFAVIHDGEQHHIYKIKKGLEQIKGEDF
jgi:hypothetical protein